MDITPGLRAKMLSTVAVMKEKNLSFMDVEGADGFSVALDERHKNVIILGAEEVEGVKYFLCQIDE